jgi:hypothetical protein
MCTLVAKSLQPAGINSRTLFIYAKKMKKLFLFLCLVLVSACASKPVEQTPMSTEMPKPVLQNSDSKPVEENIDAYGLQNYLKLNLGFNQLGFIEKSFNTCSVGFGYSGTHNCRSRTFTVIQFQLMCRNSEGTVSKAITQADLRPISRRNVKWIIKNAKGNLMTDSEGYGQIAFISARSQKLERLRLAVDKDFLYMKAGEVTQLITPKSWYD